MKILIAVPTYETILPDTFKSIWDLEAGPGMWFGFEFMRGYGAAKARNDIAKIAMDGEYEYVLFVDSDIVLPPATLKYMVEDAPDICLGLYPKKNNTEGLAEIFKLGTGDFTDLYMYDELPDGSKIKVKGGGFGCALVSTDVFRKLPYPWFKYVEYPNGSLLSEDLYFCDEAAKKGYTIYADTRVKCGHMTRKFQYK